MVVYTSQNSNLNSDEVLQIIKSPDDKLYISTRESLGRISILDLQNLSFSGFLIVRDRELNIFNLDNSPIPSNYVSTVRWIDGKCRSVRSMISYKARMASSGLSF